MNRQNGNKKAVSEEIKAAIQECAAKLGHTPTYPELQRETNMRRTVIEKYFANYSNALVACGLEPEGPGCKAPLGKLFTEYASVVRKLGEVPTMAQYELAGKYTRRPFLTRFVMWNKVAEGMLEYAERVNPEGEWESVLDILRKHCQARAAKSKTSSSTISSTGRPAVLDDRPMYGERLKIAGLAHAPVNEAGVLFLFGVMAVRLGFEATWIGTQFPDCEALREVAPGRWQRVRIEFEFQSRNFLVHAHNPTGCDLIVCWEHNWPECPLEVVELKSAVEALGSRMNANKSGDRA